jgi:hypothetical protein
MKKPKKVALILADYPSFELYCPNFTGMQDGLKILGIEHKVFSCRPTFDLKPVIEYQPDFIVYGLPDMGIHSEWHHGLRSALPNSLIVMWYGDWRGNLERKFDLSGVDYMFASNNVLDGFYEKQWKIKNVGYLPLGATVKEPEIKEKYGFPAVFIGSQKTQGIFAHRALRIREIEEANVGLRVLNGDAKDQPILREKIMKEVPSIYRSSKISLDMSQFTSIKGYTSNRHWVIPACGGFSLSERYPQCQEFYPEDTRAYFDTVDEAIEKIRYYLSHDKEREELRLKGHEHAKNHTYDKRWLQMFSVVL